MPKTILALLILLSPLAAAQKRLPFPDDYKVHPCAAKTQGLCTSFKQSEMSLFGARAQGSFIEALWLQKHWDDLTASLAPYCAKLATCYAYPGNINIFCDDVVLQEARPICDSRFPEGSKDREQCYFFLRTYGSGIQLNSRPVWLAAQECGKENPLPDAPRKLEVWIDPAQLPAGFSGPITVHAIDAETRVPIQADVTIGNENLYADTPGGRPMTGYDLEWRAKLVRVPNKKGHEDVVPPRVNVVREGYETVTFTMPIAVPKPIIEMSPKKLKTGKNQVTFSARDSETGKPVDARIMLGDAVLGEIDLRTGKQTFTIEMKRGQKLPDFWAKSPFDAYSDVVISR